MKKYMPVIIFFLVFTVPTASYALGLEFAVGGWKQSPQGYIAYEPVTDNDELDLERDCNYDDETRFTGRLKIDMPIFLPNIYLMVTPMEFDGEGSKTVNFEFGNDTFSANAPFYSKLILDHYDVGFYYGIPFIETLSAEKINIDIGLNIRIFEFEVEVRQDSPIFLEESEDFTLPVPMLYLAMQIKPVDKLAIEAEVRAISYSGNKLYSLLGRVKYNIFGPVFATAGYRYDKLKIDEEDVEVDIDFSGPFIEVGFKF